MAQQKNLMVDCVEATAGKYPSNIAFDFMGKKTTYSCLVGQIDCAAKALMSIGVKEDDIICIAMPNVPQAIIMIYAANKIGAVANMIHPLSSENEILGFVNRVEAKTILVLDQFYGNIKKIKDKTPLKNIIVASISEALNPIKAIGYRLTSGRKIKGPEKGDDFLSWNKFIGLGGNISELPKISDRTDKTALILHSGGTTGKVKGVCLSNHSVNASALQMIKANPMLDPTDRFLSVMPIFHGNGLVIGVHTMLSVGCSCVLIPRFTPESYARDLLKNKCNYMSGVPALFERLMKVDIMKKADLSFLKGIYSGADFLSVELEKELNKFFDKHNSPVHIRQGYGMTEGVVATTVNPYDVQKPGSIGKTLDGVKLKIIEPNTENELPIEEVGEIVFSSVTNMLGYYNDPEETAITMKKHSDGENWIHSGDLGYVDSDGYCFFKGRIKRMIVTNGYNVFPNELENIIEGIDFVDRCCILGIPNGEGTQKIKAFIVLKNGTPETDETKQKIIEISRKSIARYAIPKEIEFIKEMPKTKVGKVDFKALIK